MNQNLTNNLTTANLKNVVSGITDKIKNNKTKYVMFIIFGMCVIIITMLILWLHNKSQLNKTNCNNMDKLYKDFGLVHTINTSNDDYKYNLRDYYIMTAYNACSGGKFKNDMVNVCALKDIIKQGARCLDFEIYSVNNEPVIATSSVDDYTVKETYNSVPFGSMIDVIRDYAFAGGACPNPGDPLIIHMRIMSSNKKIYSKMANTIETTLSDFTLGPKYSYENLGKNLGQTPIKELMGKVIFIADKTNPLFEETDLDEYINLASNSMFMRSLRYTNGLVNSSDQTELTEFNKKCMSIILPDLSSSDDNYAAQLAWACGCQMAAMCYQNFDANLEGYMAYFATKGSAFVLKPEALRYIPTTVSDPTPQNPDYSYANRTSSSDYYSITV